MPLQECKVTAAKKFWPWPAEWGWVTVKWGCISSLKERKLESAKVLDLPSIPGWVMGPRIGTGAPCKDKPLHLTWSGVQPQIHSPIKIRQAHKNHGCYSCQLMLWCSQVFCVNRLYSCYFEAVSKISTLTEGSDMCYYIMPIFALTHKSFYKYEY